VKTSNFAYSSLNHFTLLITTLKYFRDASLDLFFVPLKKGAGEDVNIYIYISSNSRIKTKRKRLKLYLSLDLYDIQ